MNEIRKRILLAASVDKVWRFLTEPARMAEWLMDSDLVDVAEGEAFKFTAEPSGAWDGKIYCKIQEVIDKERISYTWNANDINQETLVTFDLEAVAGGTALTLVHSRFEGAAPGAPGRHAAGWTNCFKALRTLLEGPSREYDWSALKISYFVDASLEDVYSLWSTADGLTRFWADEVTCLDAGGDSRPGDEEFRNGDRIALRFPTDTRTSLEILNIETNHFVLFSFGEDYGWVRVMLSRAHGRTCIELLHFGLPDGPDDAWNIHANARGWWVANLDNIASVLMHGNDLRVREEGLSSGLGAQFSPTGEVGPVHDWSAFDVYLYYAARPEDVIDYWHKGAGLEAFFIRRAQISSGTGATRNGSDSVEAQDSYEFRFIHQFEVKGRFTEVSRDSVSFTFGGQYMVDVSVQPVGAGTLLRLHQYGMQDTQEDRVHGSLNCRSCWIHFLVNLKSVIEYGIDLRDGDPETTDAISVGYNFAA